MNTFIKQEDAVGPTQQTYQSNDIFECPMGISNQNKSMGDDRNDIGIPDNLMNNSGDPNWKGEMPKDILT
jgi:hypothetical protein